MSSIVEAFHNTVLSEDANKNASRLSLTTLVAILYRTSARTEGPVSLTAIFSLASRQA